MTTQSSASLNNEDIPVSISDTILILSRAVQPNTTNVLHDITLVGGQALNFWADHYFVEAFHNLKRNAAPKQKQ